MFYFFFHIKKFYCILANSIQVLVHIFFICQQGFNHENLNTVFDEAQIVQGQFFLIGSPKNDHVYACCPLF